jgi:hypothetical protein
MNESKIELVERLRHEGRWEEASKFKDTALADFRAKGMTRQEAADAAWDATAEAYPPLSVTGELTARAPDAPEPTTATTAAPPIPWTDLPTYADFDAEVRWVHQQFILIVEETPRGRVIHWDRATERPPSTGACSLARWAADNRTAFYKDVLPKATAKPHEPTGDEPTPEEIREAEGQAADWGRLARELQEPLDEELRANVTGVLQQRVRDMLSDWEQQCRVTLPADARARLDSAIVGLLRDSLRAFAPASAGE